MDLKKIPTNLFIIKIRKKTKKYSLIFIIINFYNLINIIKNHFQRNHFQGPSLNRFFRFIFIFLMIALAFYIFLHKFMVCSFFYDKSKLKLKRRMFMINK